MSSLICWDTRMASWAPVTLERLNWTHSSGVEDLQQEQSSDEVLCWCQQQETRVSSGFYSRLNVPLFQEY